MMGYTREMEQEEVWSVVDEVFRCGLPPAVRLLALVVLRKCGLPSARIFVAHCADDKYAREGRKARRTG